MLGAAGRLLNLGTMVGTAYGVLGIAPLFTASLPILLSPRFGGGLLGIAAPLFCASVPFTIAVGHAKKSIVAARIVDYSTMPGA